MHEILEDWQLKIFSALVQRKRDQGLNSAEEALLKLYERMVGERLQEYPLPEEPRFLDTSLWWLHAAMRNHCDPEGFVSMVEVIMASKGWGSLEVKEKATVTENGKQYEIKRIK